MTVTELALLHISPDYLLQSRNDPVETEIKQSEINPELLQNLHHAQEVLSEASGHPFGFYECISSNLKDEGRVYIVGSWNSAQLHREEFLPSEENQGLLRMLEGKVTVEFMVHFDFGLTLRDLRIFDDEEEKTEEKKRVLVITRYKLSGEKKSGFQGCFERSVGIIESFGDGVSSSKDNAVSVVGGWKIHEPEEQENTKTAEEEGEEFVLFTSWNDADHYESFVKSTEYAKWAQIEEFADRGVEVVRVKKLDFSSSG